MRAIKILLFLAIAVFIASHFVSFNSAAKNIATVFKSNIKKSEYADVIRVVDGDTVDILVNGKEDRVRLLGINAPETVDPRRPVECFGLEASEKLKELLNNKEVLLKSDSIQANRDKYERLLRYVYLGDGTLINQIMIEQGYAYEYTYDVPYKFQKEFRQSETSARTNKFGLWADGICQ